jgi:S-adenosylmethionine hydrolase
MQIITLTSDLGVSDYYVAAIKGAILSEVIDVHLVDVSHNIRAFDIAQASFFIRNCFENFPKGTIHLIGVDCEPIVDVESKENASVPAILEYKGHFFVSNDNGIFSLIVGEEKFDNFWIVDDVLSNPQAFIFPLKNILVPIVCKLAKQKEISSFATLESSFNRKFTMNPIVENHLIIGSIIHVDHYGNLITNIDKPTFERFGVDIPFTLFFRRKEYFIEEISKTYSDVPHGEKIALFNSNGFLEIAINRGATTLHGGATSLFGLHIGDAVRVEFFPKGSKDTIESLF